MDESIFALIAYLTKGWFLIGSRPTKKYLQTPHQKTCVFGALGDMEIITKISQKINSKKYISFLRKLVKKNKKICIIVDNAPWHLTKEIINFIKCNNIKMIRLPPYSPELNPSEQYWKNVKNWLGTRSWMSLSQLKKELRIAFSKDFLLPKISDY